MRSEPLDQALATAGALPALAQGQAAGVQPTGSMAGFGTQGVVPSAGHCHKLTFTWQL